MNFDPKLSTTEGLDHLAERLDPIIAAKFRWVWVDTRGPRSSASWGQIAGNQPKAHSTFKGRTKQFAARLAKAKALV